VRDLNHLQLIIIVRLAIAAGFGAAVGIERELREQAAGLRTHILVSLGACLFTLVGAYGFLALATHNTANPEPTRIASNIVVGVGFLGAGSILREGRTIHGLTTAASLWVSAAIGMAVGVGLYWASGVAVVLTLLSLWVLRPFRYRNRESHDRTDTTDPDG